jgi:hypothetical protein
MGLLDDAIREHLELKRRHGAAEDDVRRLEEEALGPVRPGGEYASTDAPVAPGPSADEPEPPANGDLDPPLGASVRDPSPEPPHEASAAGLVAEPPAAEPDDEEPAPEPALPEPPAEAPPARGGFVSDEPWLDEPDEVPPSDALDHGQPTAEFTPPDVAAGPDYVAPDEEPESEDVLEETPDFLQETPEHDRLWFEQKPPRDFDFDK